LLKRWRLKYEIGVFKNDGQKAHENGAAAKTGGRTFAAHFQAEPLRGLEVPLRRLRLGAALTSSDVADSTTLEANSLKGETVAEATFYPRKFVQGKRLRSGMEINWTQGPFSVKGEILHVSEQRNDVGIQTQELPDLISQGFYLSGAWILTGEDKSDTVKPRKDFLTGHGIGALELAARYETVRFGSAAHPGIPSRSPRSPNVLQTSDRAVTIGVNWYWNRFVRVQLNGIREVLEDALSAPIAGRDRYWTTVLALQFHM
jgi:phosphate-selective porin